MKMLAGLIIVLLLAGLIPFGLIALARSRTSTEPPVRPIQDMVQQQKFKPQRVNPMFADDRAMRPLVPGAEAREALLVPNEVLNDPDHPRLLDDRGEGVMLDDPAMYQRVCSGTETLDGKTAFVTRIPVPVTADLMRHGRERFNIYCSICHGLGGYGDGMVARRAAEMQAAGADTASGWVAPTNYHTPDIRKRPVGHIFNTITNGIRSMPSYAKQISVLDRWAIVAYEQALLRSQDAKAEDVPETERKKF